MSLQREALLCLVGLVLVLGFAHVVAQAVRRPPVQNCRTAIAYTARWFPKARFSCALEQGRYVVRALVCEGASCRRGELVAAFEVQQVR